MKHTFNTPAFTFHLDGFFFVKLRVLCQPEWSSTRVVAIFADKQEAIDYATKCVQDSPDIVTYAWVYDPTDKVWEIGD